MKNRIKELRKKLNIKQVELARAIGLPAPTLCRWENHQRKVPAEYAFKICKFFRKDFLEVFYD